MELEVFYEDSWFNCTEVLQRELHFDSPIIAVHYVSMGQFAIVYELEDGTFIECDDFWDDWRD